MSFVDFGVAQKPRAIFPHRRGGTGVAEGPRGDRKPENVSDLRRHLWDAVISADAGGLRSPNMANASNRTVKILVLDRDERFTHQISSALIQEGFACDSCNDAAQGLTSARRELPSLMIVETELDACSGFDFVRTVQDEYLGQEIPVIFVSGARTAELVDSSRRAGGIYFLGKPIDPSVLLELVDKALWMPHLVRRHIDAVAHESGPRAPRVMTEALFSRRS